MPGGAAEGRTDYPKYSTPKTTYAVTSVKTMEMAAKTGAVPLTKARMRSPMMADQLRIIGRTGIQLCVSQAGEAPGRKKEKRIQAQTKNGNAIREVPVSRRGVTRRNFQPVAIVETAAPKGLASIRASIVAFTAPPQSAPRRCR